MNIDNLLENGEKNISKGRGQVNVKPAGDNGFVDTI